MADKTSNSKMHGIGKFSNRALFQIMQKVKKVEGTRDDTFDGLEQNFNAQYNTAKRFQGEYQRFMVCAKNMSSASRNFFACLRDTYEEDWPFRPETVQRTEAYDILWQNYVATLQEDIGGPLHAYLEKFAQTKSKIEKRGRKLTDFDKAKSDYESASTAKKQDPLKIAKAQQQMEVAQNVYDTHNNLLLSELPHLYHGRVGFYGTTFQGIFSNEVHLHSELGKLSSELSDIIEKLESETAGHFNSNSFGAQSHDYHQQRSHDPNIQPHLNNRNNSEGDGVGASRPVPHPHSSHPRSDGGGSSSGGGSGGSPHSSPHFDSRRAGGGRGGPTRAVADSDEDDEVLTDGRAGDGGFHSASNIQPIHHEQRPHDSNENDIDGNKQQQRRSSSTRSNNEASSASGGGVHYVVNDTPSGRGSGGVGQHAEERLTFSGEATTSTSHQASLKSPPPSQFQDTAADESPQIFTTPPTKTAPLSYSAAPDHPAAGTGHKTSPQPLTITTPTANGYQSQSLGTTTTTTSSPSPDGQHTEERLSKSDILQGRKILYQVEATHSYEGQDDDELSFAVGDTINVIEFDDPEDEDEGWLNGIHGESGAKGVFPANFTKKI